MTNKAPYPSHTILKIAEELFSKSVANRAGNGDNPQQIDTMVSLPAWGICDHTGKFRLQAI